MKAEFFDLAGWQAMLEREGMPVSGASIGLLRREDFSARRGTLLLWQAEAEGCRAIQREYNGAAGEDVAILLVADEVALAVLREGGRALLPGLVRQGRLQPYMLKTMEELEAAGLAGFVEDLGLVFPRH